MRNNKRMNEHNGMMKSLWRGAAGLLALLTLAGAAGSARAEEVSADEMREALTVTAEVGTGLVAAAGRTIHAEVVGEDSYVTMGVGWGIQWHFDSGRFSKGLEYDVFVEFMAPAELARQVRNVVFALYVFGQAEPEGDPNRVSIARGDLTPDAWQTAKVGRVRLDDKNGYFYADLHPRELIDVNGPALRVKRFWAVPAGEDEAVRAAYAAIAEEEAEKRRFLADYQAPRFPRVERLFQFGMFFGPGGLQATCAWWGMSHYDQMRVILESARRRGFNAFTHCMIRSPEGLREYVDLAERYGLWVYAGGSVRPLDDRYATPESFARINWNHVREQLRAHAAVAAGHPRHVAYSICDEPKEWMTIPLLKALQILYEYDKETPGVISAGVGGSGFVPVVMAGPAYPFQRDPWQVEGLPEMVRIWDAQRRGLTEQQRQWSYLQAYDHRQGSRRMPTPAEMEGQVFAALATRVTGLYFYMYHQMPTWSFEEINLVDSFMNPRHEPGVAASLERLSRVAAGLRGVGELLARSEYLEEAAPVVTADIPTFETAWPGRETVETHPRAKIGLYRLEGGRGHAAVCVNLQADGETRFAARFEAAPGGAEAGPAQVADLLALEVLEKDYRGQPLELAFAPGAGKVLWIGRAGDWPAVRDEALAERLDWNLRILRDDIAVAARYLAKDQLPDLSFADGDLPPVTKMERLEAAQKVFGELRAADNPYGRAERTLAALRDELGAFEARIPFDPSVDWSTPLEQQPEAARKLLEAGSRYFKLLLKHWDEGLSAEETAAAAEQVRAALGADEK